MEMQEARKKKEALEAMQRTHEKNEKNLRRSKELSSSFINDHFNDQEL